jgi:hypothetical protein
MSELVADCPRCGASKITFDVIGHTFIGQKHRWQQWYEVFCVCRHCKKSTVFVLSDNNTEIAVLINTRGIAELSGALNSILNIESFISMKDKVGRKTPEFVPDEIGRIFEEGAKCLAIECPNAASTMFRLCVDLATRSLLPGPEDTTINHKTRRDLGLRLPWLFDHGLLPTTLKDLSSCIKEDGNDGAHVGNLNIEDAEDLIDFTSTLLERLYTEPERLKLAKERRDVRRNPSK